jgi:GTP-binding protein SAR1
MFSGIKKFFTGILSYLGLWSKKANLVFLGLDDAGKTTLLYMLKTGVFSQFKQTDHPNSDEFKFNNVQLHTFDLGGHETARKIWSDYYPNVHGIFFLVDSANPKRFPEAKKELTEILDSPQLQGVPIAILGNKIDKPGAVSEEELRDALGIDQLISKETRPMEVFMVSVAKKAGYPKALEWLDKYLPN